MKKALLFVALLLSALQGFAAEKPRVIVMTDGEVDDRCSMVRSLLYSNNVEVAGILETSSCFQRQGRSREHWLKEQLDAYEQGAGVTPVQVFEQSPEGRFLRLGARVGGSAPAIEVAMVAIHLRTVTAIHTYSGFTSDMITAVFFFSSSLCAGSTATQTFLFS